MKYNILPCKGRRMDKGGNSGGGDDIRQHCREKLRGGIRLLFIITNELRVWSERQQRHVSMPSLPSDSSDIRRRRTRMEFEFEWRNFSSKTLPKPRDWSGFYFYRSRSIIGDWVGMRISVKASWRNRSHGKEGGKARWKCERERCGFMSIAFTVLLLLCDGKEMDGVFGCWEGKWKKRRGCCCEDWREMRLLLVCFADFYL